MNKTTDRLYAWGFSATLAVLSLLFFLLPKGTFSEAENRNLAGVPEWSWASIISKAFSEGTEMYVSDHFPFRNHWVTSKSIMERLRLQQENNGVYFGEQGYLLEKFAEPDEELLGRITDAINRFAAARPELGTTLLLAPNSIGMYPELLPPFAPSHKQREVNDWIGGRLSSQIAYLNGFEFLEEAAREGRKPVYYRTDHHWTTYGAYLGYRAYAEHKGWQPLEESDFAVVAVSDSFLGSYHTRSRYAGAGPDSIERYDAKKPVKVQMEIADSGAVKDQLYEESFLSKKDKYSYFQGGVHPLVKVTGNTGRPEAVNRKLLVVKDSYAHSMLPFLSNHNDEIHMIDIRFYNGPIGKYAEDNGITDVLLIFNTNTFVGERNLLKLGY